MSTTENSLPPDDMPVTPNSEPSQTDSVLKVPPRHQASTGEIAGNPEGSNEAPHSTISPRQARQRLNVPIHIFVGQNFKLFNGLIRKPVLIFKAAFGVSGFSGIIDAGVKVYADLAVGICGNGSHLLGTFFIGVNGDLPALKGLAGIG